MVGRGLPRACAAVAASAVAILAVLAALPAAPALAPGGATTSPITSPSPTEDEAALAAASQPSGASSAPSAPSVLDSLPACSVTASATVQRCAFTCVAGQEVHAFLEGTGTVRVQCGGDGCERQTTAMGGCRYKALQTGVGTCIVEGVGEGRCHSLPAV